MTAKKGYIKNGWYWHKVNGEDTPFWEIVDEMPNGWQIDNQTDSPLPYSVFINNGKSPLSGERKTKILNLKKQNYDI